MVRVGVGGRSAAVAAEIEAAAQTNALGLVTGAAKRGAVTQSRTLQDFWGKPKKAKTEPAPAAKPEAPPRPPTMAEAPPPVKAEPSAAVKKKEPAEVIEID